MPFPTSEVAGIAIQQILSQPTEGEGDVSFEPDRKSEAEYYADLAVQELKDEYEWDPATENTTRAKQAVIRFVKVSLLSGDASVDPQFIRLADKWAMSVNRDKNQTDRDDNSDTYEGRRIDLYDTLDN